MKEVRERQIPYDSTYISDLKYDTAEPIYEQTDSQTESRLGVAKGRGVQRESLGAWSWQTQSSIHARVHRPSCAAPGRVQHL